MAIKKCKECGKEVSTSAKMCPHCGKRYPTGGLTWPAKIFLGLLVIGFLPSMLRDCGNTTTPSSSTPSVSAPSLPKESNLKSYSSEQIQAAQTVMDTARKDCNIFEEGPHLVVEMKMYVSDPNQLLSYVKAIANSDVVLKGKPRNIYFYDPSNNKIAQADTLNGIRLLNK